MPHDKDPQPSDRDRNFADTGWGIKPDDQPANAAEAGDRARRCYRYDPAEPDVVRKILVAQRRGFNTANRVRLEAGRTTILDLNADPFTIEGLTYGDENLITLLKHLGAPINPQEIRRLPPDDPTVREYTLSRVWAWGAERTG
jgi:hypothetical protein